MAIGGSGAAVRAEVDVRDQITAFKRKLAPENVDYAVLHGLNRSNFCRAELEAVPCKIPLEKSAASFILNRKPSL
jgi:hypothetical protein